MSETVSASASAGRATTAGLLAALATTAGFASANLITSLLRNKGLAVMLDPAGFGRWSQVMSFFYMVQAAAVLGITTGVTRYVAQYRREGKDPGVVISSALAIVGGVAACLSVIVVVGAPWLARAVVGRADWWWVFMVVAAGVPLVAVQSVMRAGLQGFEDYRRLALAGVLGAFGALAVALAAAFLVGAEGVGFFVAGSFALAALLYGLGLRRHIRFDWIARPDPKLVRGVLAYGGVALGGTLAAAAANLTGRSLLLHIYGAESAGFYQAMSGLTLQILPVFLAGIGLYVVPKLAGEHDAALTADVVTRVLRIVLLAVVPALALGCVLREPFFRIVFTAEFLAAADWFPLQLTGDLFLAVAWASGSHLLPTGRLRTFLICETVRAAVLLGVAWLLLTLRLGDGIGAMAIAHTLSYLLEAVAFLWIASRQREISLAKLAPTFAAAAAGWSLVVAASYTYGIGWRLVAWALAVVVLWQVTLVASERRAAFQAAGRVLRMRRKRK